MAVAITMTSGIKLDDAGLRSPTRKFL